MSERYATRIRRLLAIPILMSVYPATGCFDRPPTHEAAIAMLAPLADSGVRGTVHFEAMEEGGLRVRSEVSGLTQGAHAYHVHVHGDCSAPDGSSAGPHFSFERVRDADRIAGNVGELVAGKSGRAQHMTVIEHATLSGDRSILGRSVVVHARGNDPSEPPDGAAGERLACGVVAAAGAPGQSS